MSYFFRKIGNLHQPDERVKEEVHAACREFVMCYPNVGGVPMYPTTEVTYILEAILAHFVTIRVPAGAFQPGLTDMEIDKRTASLPHPLPPEVRELYRWRNGQSFDPQYLPYRGPCQYRLYKDFIFLPLEEAVQEWQTFVEWDDAKWRSQDWLPFLREDASQFCVSLTPDAEGDYAIIYRSEYGSGRKFGRSLRDFLAAIEEEKGHQADPTIYPDHGANVYTKYHCGFGFYENREPVPLR